MTYLGSEVLPVTFDGDAAVIASLVQYSKVGTKVFPIPAGSRAFLLLSYMYV